MFTLHKEIYTFYFDYVRLSTEQRNELAGYRDANFDRLKAGLDELEYPLPVRKCDQGSYAMHTSNQHPKNESRLHSSFVSFKRGESEILSLKAFTDH